MLSHTCVTNHSTVQSVSLSHQGQIDYTAITKKAIIGWLMFKDFYIKIGLRKD